MSHSKEIASKIKSIDSTKKITKAMEMVAASKMRRAQNRMNDSKPYVARVLDVVSHLVRSKLEYTHPYLKTRSIKKAAFLVVSSDRGLCGGLNINLFKKVVKETKELQSNSVSSVVATIGKKAESFFVKNNFEVTASVSDISGIIRIKDLIGVIKSLLDLYEKQEIDAIYVASNKFVSTISQLPQIQLLLPAEGGMTDKKQTGQDYIYEPSPELLLDILLKRYVESLVYQSVVENFACEQAARMVAMKNASDNAQELIDECRLQYNKARQAAITKELAEISAGAAAV